MPRLRLQVGGGLATVSDWSNTFEFLLSGPVPSQAVLQTIVNAIFTGVSGSTAAKSALGTDTTMVNFKALHYPANTGASNYVATSTGAAVAGTVNASHAPQVCVVASLRTAIAGRSYRGRAYVPYRGVSIAPSGVLNVTGQNLVAGYITAVVNAVVSALAAQSLTCSWIVWSPKLGTGSAISALLVGSQCDTIRHRNRNRAEAYASYTVPVTSIAATSVDDELRIAALQNAFIHGVVTDPSGPLADVASAAIDLIPFVPEAEVSDPELPFPAEGE